MPLDDQTYENVIPPAVRRASQRADELARANGIAGVPEPELQQAADRIPTDPEAKPPAEPVAEAQPEPPAEPEPPAPAEPPQPDWEQRFRTLEGKYNSEGAQLRSQVATLERLIASMQQAPSAPPEPAPREVTTTVVIPPEDAEAYGQELIDAARRWARAELQGEIDRLRGEMQELRGGVQRVQVETVQQRVERALNEDPALTGKWRSLNTDPGFLSWLAQVDPFSGQPRQQLLTEAAAAGDGVRCAQFFKSYLDEHTATTAQPSPTVEVQTEPQLGNADPRPSLEELAAPGRAAGTGAPSGASSERRVWTNRDIAAFYRARTEGRYAGREAEALRLEQEIFAAARERRIRN